MLDSFILCVYETLKDTLQIGLFLVIDSTYRLRKALLTMNSNVEVRETLIQSVSAESKNTLYFL